MYGAARSSRARPLTRKVSVRPGMRKMSPTCGLDRMLRNPSARRLPGRSGMAIVESSMTWTKPFGSPLGDTSQLPSAAEVASRRNGEAAIHCRSSACNARRSLAAARGIGVPSSSRNSSSDVISVSSKLCVMTQA